MSEMQKDLVLSPNEYAYVLDETKGDVKCHVGPYKTSMSQSDTLIRFDPKSKKFVPCSFSEVKQLFVTAPEGWYIALKNPVEGNKHPTPGTSNMIPDNVKTGCKVNISGPASFALYPGQMAEVIKGHTLRSNQYLVARVYDAESLNKTKADRGEPDHEDYVNGQILIIKGTEISFYIPPTGIEIKAIENNKSKGYVRDAITLERLEYCILKDEDGNKRYVHGPEVVFPSPTETFIQDNNGHVKRNAIELSDISGVYVKVIADYKDENGKEYKTGDELFITGKDQMIYYPRPEHTFISYNGRILHHAIAIPKGEGRYIMNRMTGDIKTVKGPAMYLPDPRTEVAVKRTLTRNQCEMWYPGNLEVLAANGYGAVKDATFNFEGSPVGTFCDTTMFAAVNNVYTGTPTKKESNKINRSNTFTQPRTISLDSGKYEGAVAIDVWTGYAVNVISKDGSREVIQGPRTILLDYDQTLEMLELSTGKPKTTDNLEKVAFLRYENNRVSDIINIETSDFVNASVKVSYHVNFDPDMFDKWFSVDNYVKHLCDWARSTIKKAAKEFSIADFHANYQEIILAALKDDETNGYLHKFDENGMIISDVEILSMAVENSIQRLIDEHQEQIVSKALELTAAKNSAETEREINALETEKAQMKEELARVQMQLAAETKAKKFALLVEEEKAKNEEQRRVSEFNKEIQGLKDAIFAAEQERLRQGREADRAHEEQIAELVMRREAHAAQAMKTVLEALGPDLAAALNNSNNQKVIEKVAESVAPYAIANGESVSEAVNRLIRGTTLGDVVNQVMKQ